MQQHHDTPVGRPAQTGALGGVIPALVTFFTDDGELDIEALRAQVTRLLDAGVHGLLVCGTTGEGGTMTVSEKRRVSSVVIETVGNRVPVIAGVIQPDTVNALREARELAAHGADYLAVVSPYYGRVTDAEMIAHFTALAEEAPRPILLYDIPGNTGNPVTDPVYQALLPHPNVCGVKDSSGDFSSFSRRVLEWSSHGAAAFSPDDRGISWIQGNDTLNAPAMFVGAAGFVTGLGNIIPEPFVELYTAAARGDTARMLEMQRIANSLHGIVRRTGTVGPAIRMALSETGYGSARMRSHTFTLSADWADAVREIVIQVGRQYRAAVPV
jgi:4-hydroxy-tetrahydrodipicolinate synthase